MSDGYDREDARCPNCGNESILELHCEHCGYGLDALEGSQRDQKVDQKDWSGVVSIMLAVTTLLVVGVAKLVSIGLAGGFAALFLVVWALYFVHPRVKVVEQ